MIKTSVGSDRANCSDWVIDCAKEGGGGGGTSGFTFRGAGGAIFSKSSWVIIVTVL